MLKTVIDDIYDNYIALIKAKNIDDENAELGQFLGEIFNSNASGETSYAREIQNLKTQAAEGNPHYLEKCLLILEGILYFSYGHDMVYKKKIEVDCFMPEPLDSIIRPAMEAEIQGLFNDVSVMPENPNRARNVETIRQIIAKHLDFSSLLFMLYVYDWHFPKGWETLYPKTAGELETMVESTSIKIGQFLEALINYKITCIQEVFALVPDAKLRADYLAKVDAIASEQKDQLSSFTHTHLPVSYFKYNTIYDFLKNPLPEQPSPIIFE